MEKKERSRSRSPIIMKSVDNSATNVIDDTREDTKTKHNVNIVKQEPLHIKEESSSLDVQIVELDQSLKAEQIEIYDSDDDVDVTASEISNRAPARKSQKTKYSPCTMLCVSNLPSGYGLGKYRKMILQAIGNATKYSVFFYAPRDVNYSIIGEILIQCANPVECSNVFRLLRKNFEPPITVVKDKGNAIAKKLDYKPREFAQFKLNPNFNKGTDFTVMRGLLNQVQIRKSQNDVQNPNPASSVILEDPSGVKPLCNIDTLPNFKPVFVKPDPPVNNTFGLNMQYLNKIGVRLPLKNRVFVQNMIPEITVEKVREVFSLAGTVRHVKLTIDNPTSFNNAVVEFDHPVEAVQAISMLDGRKLYNRVMKVCFDVLHNPKPLPLGLESIGPGLGPNGQPLRAIHATLAVKPIIDALQQMGKLSSKHNQSIYNANMFKRAENNPVNQSNVTNNINASNQPNYSFGSNSLQTAPSQNMQANPNTWCNTPNLNANTVLAQFGLNMEQVIANMGQNMAQYISCMGQNMPSMGQNILNMGQNMPNMGQNMPNMGQNMPSMGQNMTNMGQNMPNLGQNILNMGQNIPNMGQNMPCMGENMPNLGQNILNMGQNIPNTGQNMPCMGENMPNLGQNIHNIGQNTPNFNQYSGNNNNFGPPTTFKASSPKASSVVPNNMTSSVEYAAEGQNHPPDLCFNSEKLDKVSTDDRQKQKDNATKKNVFMLVFSNLPNSVNTEALNAKMREVGKIVFGEMTGPGRAIVRFQNSADAERCIKLFDHSKVDGQVIHVKYF